MWLGIPKPMIPYPLLWEGAVRTVGSHLVCIPSCSEVPDTPHPPWGTALPAPPPPNAPPPGTPPKTPLPTPPPPTALLQRTTSKSHIGELAPMALCDIHVAGCGEHLPA